MTWSMVSERFKSMSGGHRHDRRTPATQPLPIDHGAADQTGPAAGSWGGPYPQEPTWPGQWAYLKYV